MTVLNHSGKAQRVPSQPLVRFCWAVLGYFVAVILWGAVVRATGSGAGCGNHWPLCNGTVLLHEASTSTLIEFVHRITSGLSLLLVLGLTLWCWTTTKAGDIARTTSAAAVFFTITEAILGALLVALGLTAESQSLLRPWFLALHLSNTLLLLAALAMTAHLAGRSTGYSWQTVRIVAPWPALCGLFAVLAVAVTGSLAALGDTLFPAASLSGALSSDFLSTSTWLVRWRWSHPALALIASGFLVWLLIRSARTAGKQKNRLLARTLDSLLLCVYLLGAINVLLLAPVWSQLAHLLAADSLWIALVVLTTRLTLQPSDAA